MAFVHKDGGLYEMDGRKPKPTRHGNTTPDTLLEVRKPYTHKLFVSPQSEAVLLMFE